MTEEDAAAKIVHDPKFEWMPGMWFRIDDGRRGVVVDISELGATTTLASYTQYGWNRTNKVLVPNAATIGCLQELVRRLWNKPISFCQAYLDDEEIENWAIVNMDDGDMLITEFSGDSQIEVLLRALEGAPVC